MEVAIGTCFQASVILVIYFAMAFRKTIDKYDNASVGMDVWSDHIKSFGLGNFLEMTYPLEKRKYSRRSLL